MTVIVLLFICQFIPGKCQISKFSVNIVQWHLENTEMMDLQSIRLTSLNRTKNTVFLLWNHDLKI